MQAGDLQQAIDYADAAVAEEPTLREAHETRIEISLLGAARAHTLWSLIDYARRFEVDLQWLRNLDGYDAFVAAPEDEPSHRAPDAGAKPSSPVADQRPASDPVVVVLDWCEAARRGDASAAYALGTPAFVRDEKSRAASFSTAIFVEGVKLLTGKIQEQHTDGDQATVTVRAQLESDGEVDGEPMHFRLARVDGIWRIVALN